eukprot:Amastigsp_a341698_20.p3 type:complete len:114 gc:universal Amastigsp_a341698_20:474-815(+)
MSEGRGSLRPCSTPRLRPFSTMCSAGSRPSRGRQCSAASPRRALCMRAFCRFCSAFPMTFTQAYFATAQLPWSGHSRRRGWARATRGSTTNASPSSSSGSSGRALALARASSW